MFRASVVKTSSLTFWYQMNVFPQTVKPAFYITLSESESRTFVDNIKQSADQVGFVSWQSSFQHSTYCDGKFLARKQIPMLQQPHLPNLSTCDIHTSTPKKLAWSHMRTFRVNMTTQITLEQIFPATIFQANVYIKSEYTPVIWTWPHPLNTIVPISVPYGATVLEEPWPPSRQISIRLFSEPSLSSR
jgi:hypothetical protein